MGDSSVLQNGLTHLENAGRPQADVLQVLIAGGGIGGLVAAISLRQQGHYVQVSFQTPWPVTYIDRKKVFEQSRFANEVGAAIHMTPNAMGILLQLGIDPRNAGAVPLDLVCGLMHFEPRR